MSNKLKRFLSLMLVFVMVLSIVPANAEDLGVVVSGTSTSEEGGPAGASSAFDKLTAAFGNNNAPEEDEEPGDDTTGDDATTGGDATTGDDTTGGDATTGDDTTTGGAADDDVTTGGDPMTEGGTVAGGNGNSNLRIKVAQIGETRFNSLKEAVNAAAEGQTIVLLTDVEMSSSMTIDKAITLDLNGKTIILTHGGVIKIAALDKVVTISNGTVKADKGGTAIRVIAGAEVALPGCMVDGELIDENIPVEDTVPGDAVEGDDEMTGDEPAVEETPEESLLASDEKGSEPQGVLSNSLVDMDDPAETFLAAEITGLNATESVEIKLFDAKGTLLATTTLLKPEYFTTDPLGVKIIITGDSSSWETVWELGMLSAAHVPSYMELYVDGLYMNQANVPMVCTGGEQGVEWAEVPGVPTFIEVATFEELVTMLAEGQDIILTADITTTAAISTVGIDVIINLDGHKLTIGAGDNKFIDKTNLTIENGTIDITGVTVGGNAIFCLDEYEKTTPTTLTLNGVNVVGEGYSSAYCVFYIGDSSTLNVNGGVWKLSDDASEDGGLFKSETSAATLNISGANMTLHNVRRVVTYAATTIKDTTIKVTGDADGVDAEMEHGFNRSPLTITDSTITMSNMVGRGITAQNGAVTIENSTVTMTNCQEATIDVRNGQTVTIDATSNVTVDAEPTITNGTINGTVNVIDTTKVVEVAYANGTVEKYASLAEALEAAKNETNIVINLLADATLDITAWKTLAIGGEATSTITINGNGKTLTFNKLNSDWNNVATNGAKLILNNMTINDSGYNNGPWNRYDIVFDCPVELNSVTSSKALAFESSAVLNTVTINESGDNYAIWIQPNGQTVSINGLTVNSAGRGIKIDDQYVGTAGHVTLTVKNATFTTAKKAAILVKSSAGATVTVENVNIANVAADSENVVWNDEDAAAYFGKINVTGGTKAQEAVENFAAAVSVDGAVQAYYGTIADAITAAQAGETITLLADGELVDSVAVSDTIIDLAGHTLTIADGKTIDVSGSLKLNGEGTVAGNIVLTDAAATVTGPEALNVTTTVTDSKVDYVDGVYKVIAKVYVAQVGETKYATIDEAVAAWTNGTTLTLLADVNLSDVIQLSSIEKHILNLGTYTMTAAKSKNAIEIVNNGRSSAGYALDITADAENPGGITATGKAIVKTTGKSGVKDRPIIRFYNGVFNASYIAQHSGSSGTNCPQFYFYGGEFNGTVYTNRTLNQFHGGTFNGSLMMSVDSSAYTLIAGGKFKQLSNLYGSALNSGKFTIGSAKGVYDKGIYVDVDGYFVVGGPVITTDDAEGTFALSTTYHDQMQTINGYLYYSSAAANGLFYKENTTVDLVKVITDTAKQSSDQKLNLYQTFDLSGEITVKNNLTVNVNGNEFGTPTFVLTKELGQKLTSDTKLNVTTTVSNCVVLEAKAGDVYTYTVSEAVAQIGETVYGTLDEAFAAAVDGDEVMILKAGTYALNTSGKNITITGSVAGVVFDNIGERNLGGASITFNNVTFNYASNSTYKGLQHSGDLTYKNCTINGQVFLYGTSETFSNCIFNTTDANNYNVWLYSADNVTFSGCTFNCAGKSVLLYTEGANERTNLNVVDCDFIASSAVEGKAAIEIDTSLMVNTTSKVTIDAATTATGFDAGSVSGETLWNDKKDKTNIEVWVADVQVWPIFVAQIGETKYTTLTAAVAAANATEGGATVTLLKDVKLGEKLTISGNVAIEGAYTITRDAAYTGTLFAVDAGAALTLDGGLTIDGGNAWTYTKTPLDMDMANGAGTTVTNHITPAEGGVNITANVIENKGTLNANSVTIQNSYSTNNVHLINAGANSKTIINGATIKNIAANASGAVAYIGGADAVLTIKGGTQITGNFGISNGGIIQNYGQGTTVNFEGGSISNNHIGKSGTLYASYSSNASKINTFNMSGGSITNNIMEGYGPVYIHTNTVWNMTGGTISGNTSFLPNYVRNNNPAGTMSGGRIVDNVITGLDYSDGYYVTHPDLRLNGKTGITGGTYTQDVTEYLAPYYGLAIKVREDGVTEYTVTDEIAEVNGVVYHSVAEAVAAANSGNTVTVLVSHKVDATTVVDKDVTIDLNGKTIITKSTSEEFIDVLTILANVIITGDGKIDARPADGFAAYVGSKEGEYGNLTIASGTFYGNSSAVQVTNGTLTINGGKFAVEPYEGSYAYLLNCMDANYDSGAAKIFVQGGTFYMFDPANNAAEGEGTDFVADGYISEELTENYWTVRKANFVAQIGDVKYESLDEAFKAAVDGDEVKILVADTYVLSTSGKNLTITGDVDGVVFDNIGAKNMGGANVTFNNVTFDYYPNVNYTGLQHSGNLTYNNCTFNGQVFLYGTSETFTDCTFNQNSADAYNVWLYSAADVDFTGCTFNSAGKSVLLYHENANTANIVNVVDCDFIATSAVEGKAAIEIDTSLMVNATSKVTIDAATTATGFDAGSVSGETLWNDKKNKTNIEVWVADVQVWPIFVATVTDTEGNVTKYTTLTAAIAAAQADNTIAFLADITEDVTVDKNVTVDGAEFQYTGTMTVATSKTVTIENVNFVKGCITEAKGSHGNLTVKNCDFDGVDNTVAYAVTMRGGDSVTMEGCTAKNYDYGMLYVPSAVSNVTVKDVTAEGFNYGVHVAYGVNVALENVKMTNVAYGIMTQNYGAKTITVKNSELNGTNAIYVWDRNTTVVDTFKFEGANTASALPAGTQAKLVLVDVNSTLTAPEGFDVITEVADHKVVYEDGMYKVVAKTYVAETLGVKYETLEEALEAAKNEQNIVVNLLADATLDITAWQTLAIGGDATSTITINGNGKTLDVYKKNSDWNHIATNNGAKLILNNMTITDSGYNNGPWNRYDINFACPVELNNVISTKALAFKSNATLNNVTVNESGDNYAIWIQANGQTVTIDGLDVNSAGRGIKIDEQYTDARVVNLTVKNADFDTAKKAAIIVKSSVGANVTVENIDITGVAADTTNAVWNDEDAAVHYGKVKVNGGTKAQEGDFAVAIIKDAEVWAYYKTLPEAVEAVQNGESIELAANVELAEAYELPKSITLETKGYTLTGELQLNDAALTLTSTNAELNVTTNIAGKTVVYENGAYAIADAVASVTDAEGNVTYYGTLAAAIAGAEAGDTVTLLKDITEDVTVDKSVIIDGAENKYTGNISVTGTSSAVTVKNVNFAGGEGYAITTNRIKSITVENCTAQNYGYGFLYANKSTPTVVVKDVTVTGGNYGMHWVYGTSATLENVTMNEVVNGLLIQNYADKAITVKNSTISSIEIWERNGVSGVQTFKLEGANTAGALSSSEYAKYILVDVNSTLTAPEGFDVITEVADHKVVYEDGMYKVVEKVYVAQIGEVKYETLQAAADAAVNGDTVVLLTDIAEDVVVEQKPDVKFTIDGDGKTLDGTITVNGKSARYATAGLTIQNVNFKADTITEDAFINLGGNNTIRYTSNVTVTNCTFTAEPRNEGIVAIKQYTGGCKNLTVDNCTATGVHSLIQLKNVEEGLAITDCKVTDSKNGISVGNSINAAISGCTMDVDGYGIRADGNIANKLNVSDCTIDADMPIVVRKTTAAYELAISGANTLTAGNADGYQVIFTNDDDGTYEEPTGAFVYTADEANAELKVFPTYVAEIDGKGFMTLTAAVEAAEAGDTITLLKDIELTEAIVLTQSIGLEKNGLNLTAELQLNDAALTLTSTDADLNVTTNVEGKIVVYENGMYAVVDAVASVTDAEGNVTYYSTLAEAINAAESGDTVTILTEGPHKLPGFSKNLTIEAAEGVAAAIDMSKAVNLRGSEVVFNGLTFNYSTNANYIGLHEVASETYNNCVINGQMFAYGNPASFTDCEFNQISAGAYNIWTYGADNATFTNCDFNSAGKAMLIYNEGDCSPNVTVTGCTFTASEPVDGKAAIEIDTSLMKTGKTLITITDTAATGFAAGSISGETLWNDKKDLTNLDVYVDGEHVWPLDPVATITDAEGNVTEYRSLQKAVDAAADGDKIVVIKEHSVKSTVIIDKDVTLDLNGLTVKAGETVVGAPVIRVLANVTVTNGTVDGTTGTNSYAFIVGNNSTSGSLTIADGTYIGVTSAISVTNGVANISGGEFKTGHDGEGTDYGAKYLLNCMDSAYNAGNANYNITGGTFYGFNPENNTAEGEGTNFVAEGHKAVDNGNGSWTVTVDDKFYFYAAQVVAGNSLDMMFAFRQDELDDWTGHYVQITREFGDGTEPEVTTVPVEDWGTSGSTFYTVTYGNLAAKEMSDQLTLVVCNAEGEEVSYPWIDSMRAYAMRMLEKATDDTARTLFVDMLNYGAAAQAHFGYNTADLANNQLSEEQKGYASTLKEMTAGLDQGDKHVGSNLITKSNIQFWVAFKGLTTDMYAVVEYTSHHPDDKTIRIEGSEFGTLAGTYYLNINELVCADARQVMTITIYNADGSVYTTCQESIEDYLARQSSLSDAYQKAMQFFDSCYAYLHK